MKFFDAHIHFYFTCPPDELKRTFHRLTKMGMAGFDALVMAEYPENMKKLLAMMPAALHESVTLPDMKMQQNPFPYFDWAHPLMVVPYLDTRYVERDIEGKIKSFKEQGYRGIKLLYVPEEDTTIRMAGMQEAFGWSVKTAETITARLVDSAASQGMCVLFHADIRRYGDFVAEMIQSHPQTNFNIPHFGFSRKVIAHFLETYPNCYSDASFLTPFMEEDPPSYRSFISDYRKKILYGSDARIDDPNCMESSLQFIKGLLDDEEIFQQLTWNNYQAFHRLSQRGT